MLEYYIYTASTPRRLITKVKIAMEEGWKALGGVTCTKTFSAQAMTRNTIPKELIMDNTRPPLPVTTQELPDVITIPMEYLDSVLALTPEQRQEIFKKACLKVPWKEIKGVTKNTKQSLWKRFIDWLSYLPWGRH